MNSGPNDNGWQEWSKHVLIELKRLDTSVKDVDVEVRKIHIEIAMLKVKSGMWGAIGAAIVLLPAFLIGYFTK